MKTRAGKELKTLAEVIQWWRDRTAGLRGAFGHHHRALIVDKWHARNTARGPRLGTWWKGVRLQQLIDWVQVPYSPPTYTRPLPKKQKLGDRSFHPGMMNRKHRQRQGDAGFSKSATCKATWLQRYVCRGARACRTAIYESVWLSIDKKAGRKHPTNTQGFGRRGIVRPRTFEGFADWLGSYLRGEITQ